MLPIRPGSREGTVSLEVSIKKCEQTKQWSAALQLLREAVQLGVKLLPGHYIATVGACRTSGQWQRALSVLGEMWGSKVEPNVISYCAGVSACEKGGQWQWALSLLSDWSEAKRDPDSPSEYSLQRWDRRVWERPAVAAGCGAAQENV
ncbi:unnamed protein product [Prorocentrum cordatum]|uniref:Pentatricopeptide repeat-containing protein, chloroplastic n=1 Tax=Prorocentrum cordatum TaxID=2364126 RepID=A0ABN9TAL0_9DINO|nr:unnamed protein product [Polarella glacialis]